MESYDCVVVYNAAMAAEKAGSREKMYPANVAREEVAAIDESLRGAGYHPLVLSIERVSLELIERLIALDPRFVFNLCDELDGKGSMEMYFAGLLELLGIPFTGSDSFTLGFALQKHRVKQVLEYEGIPVPRGCLCPVGVRPDVRWNPEFPVIVKPASEDASLGINSDSVCRSFEEAMRQVGYIHEVYGQEALVEEYLEGREFNVSVIGDDDPEVLAISEIDFSQLPDTEPRIVSYRAKWDESSLQYDATTPICPAIISDEMKERIGAVAIASYRAVGCRDYGRVDMRTDRREGIHVLEVNPNPDISPKAGFARAARAAGYSYEEIVLRISECALERGETWTYAAYAF